MSVFTPGVQPKASAEFLNHTSSHNVLPASTDNTSQLIHVLKEKP
jgi:hypothetical protein